MSELWVAHLGRVPYRDAVALQQHVRERRQADEIPDTLLVLEHPPVYTKGRRTQPADLPMGEDWYRLQGIEVEETDRGGRVTYHGPGQLVAYPIMRIDEIPAYVARVEQAMIAALADEGIEACLREGLTGVWVGPCGIDQLRMTSVCKETGRGGSLPCFRKRLAYRFAEACGLRQRIVSLRRLAERELVAA